MKKAVTISTITPVYCGEDYLEKLIQKIEVVKNELESKFDEFEIIESIFILDDPIDKSEKVLDELKERYSWIKILQLSRNFGQHPSTIAGILHSSGEWVVTMDEDMQHDPKYIPYMLYRCTNESKDICYASPIDEVHNNVIRDKVSILFKYIIGKLTNNSNVKHFNSFRLIRGNIARASAAVCRKETYFDIAISWFTSRLTVLQINMRDLRYQETKKSNYSILGLIKHAKRMVMTSKLKFTRMGMVFGLTSFLLSMIFGILTLAAYVLRFEIIVKGWSSIILAIFFFGGIVSLMIGIVLESISEILSNIYGKPTFFTVDRSEDEYISKLLRSYKLDDNL